MVRVRRLLERREMAGGAILGSSGELSTHVALRTHQVHVCARQRERSHRRVIEFGACPRGSGVALRARLRETEPQVVRVLRRVEIVGVATDASGRSPCVLPADVALRAIEAAMGAGQRESSRAVVEARPRPRQRCVALRASLRETRGSVGRILGVVEIVQVTPDAIGRSPLKLSANVALRTRQAGVRAGQGEAGECRVIEDSSRPGVRVMALRARLRESRFRVIGIGRGIKVFQVAGDAVGRCSLEMPADMAGGTVESGVGAGERKAAKASVIEARALPGVHTAVALIASCWEADRLMIRRLRPHVRAHVTTGAIGRQSTELASGSALMAGTAFQDRVCTQQRKSVLVVADRFHRDYPAHHTVALFALRAQSPAVNVRVTIGALFPDIGEYGLGVALGAGHALVHSAQRVARGVVIEFGAVANRLPAAKGVAVLARNG